MSKASAGSLSKFRRMGIRRLGNGKLLFVNLTSTTARRSRKENISEAVVVVVKVFYTRNCQESSLIDSPFGAPRS